jgi:hypothetical protein
VSREGPPLTANRFCGGGGGGCLEIPEVGLPSRQIHVADDIAVLQRVENMHPEVRALLGVYVSRAARKCRGGRPRKPLCSARTGASLVSEFAASAGSDSSSSGRPEISSTIEPPLFESRFSLNHRLAGWNRAGRITIRLLAWPVSAGRPGGGRRPPFRNSSAPSYASVRGRSSVP